MKKLTLTIAIAFIVSASMAQKIKLADTSRTDTSLMGTIGATATTSRSIHIVQPKPDTIPVLAYCLIDFDKAEFKWIKMYVVKQDWYEGLLFRIPNVQGGVYEAYLMPDRKTKSTYRVIFALNK